jgi:hypothetical protein
LRIAFILIWTVEHSGFGQRLHLLITCFGGCSTGPSNPYAAMHPAKFLRIEADEVELEVVID